MLVLQNAPRERLAALARDPAFIGRLASADPARRAYLTRRSWFEQQYPQTPFTRVHTSARSSTSPTRCRCMYSGWLDALAGDHPKTASDLGTPPVAVGLFFHEGYFRQVIDVDGWQREFYPNNSPTSMPVRPLLADAAPAPAFEWHCQTMKARIDLSDKQALLDAMNGRRP
jgi:starch phosphorylase